MATSTLRANACSPEHFSFPTLLGVQLQTITALTLHAYTGYSGYKPEATLIGTNGVHACNVTVSYTHPGHDDQVSVQIWLPTLNYNRRFVGVGGGGWAAGEIGSDIMSTLVSQGYAVATTNAGYEHNVYGTADTWLMKSPGNLDYPLIVNFAHRALHEMTVIGKHLVAEAFDSTIEFSYWHGCSTGGRQGLTLAQNYPDDYDGILTSCTAVDFPALMVAMYWPQFLMNQMGVYPPPCEFEAITTAITRRCDELDGVRDGMIARPELCSLDPMSLIGSKVDCGKQQTSISANAAALYEAMLRGPVDFEGTQLFPGVTMGTTVVGLMATANTFCENERCFRGSPFRIADDWIRLMVRKDPTFDPTKMTHMEYTRAFHQSVREWSGLFNSNNPDLRDFHRLGKKMISWHSNNDEAVPVAAMRHYYDKVLAFDRKLNATTQDYYRYFEVPGATHCSAPVGNPYPIDALGTLRSWVEEGILPEDLPAITLGADVESEQRQWTLCAYPNNAVIASSGFDCSRALKEGQEPARNSRDEL